LATPTQAGLIGDTIVCYCGSSLSTSSAVVGTAIEFSAVNSYLNFDFSNSHLTITSTTSLGWGNFSNFLVVLMKILQMFLFFKTMDSQVELLITLALM